MPHIALRQRAIAFAGGTTPALVGNRARAWRLILRAWLADARGALA
jgi:hypothetical protein